MGNKNSKKVSKIQVLKPEDSDEEVGNAKAANCTNSCAAEIIEDEEEGRHTASFVSVCSDDHFGSVEVSSTNSKDDAMFKSAQGPSSSESEYHLESPQEKGSLATDNFVKEIQDTEFAEYSTDEADARMSIDCTQSTEHETSFKESESRDSEEEQCMEDIRDRPVTRRSMIIVAQNIGRDWKPFARELITDPEVDDIFQREDGIENRTYEAIRKWQQQNSSAATMKVLAFHLAAITRNDLVAKIMNEPFCQSPEPTVEPQAGQTESTGTQNPLLKIRQTLKSTYRALKMKGLAWMKDIVITLAEYYVDLIMTKVDQRGREASENLFIEDIFMIDQVYRNPVRILVEGGPGSGKTTLAAKLAYDWANDEKYIRHFDLVLLLPVRLFEGNWKSTLEKVVKKKDKDYLFRIINDELKTILFILDGYDEASGKTEQIIHPLLENECFAHVSVVVTSRRGKFTFGKEAADETEFFAKADCAPAFTCFIHKQVVVKGFNERQQKMFIDKHMASFSEQQKSKVKAKFDKMVDKEFLTCPLFLLMLIVVFTSNEDVKDTETKTGLYKHIFNLVINRYFHKLSAGNASDHSFQKIDLFSFDEIGKNPPHIVLMTQFSQFALKAIKRNSHVFTRDEIVATYNCDPRILGLGFLKQNLSVEGIRECVTFEPVHKSLLEFAAAYGLYLLHRHENNYLFFRDVPTFRPGESYASLFFPFLMGLLQESAGILFKTIISYAFEYSCKFEYLQSSLIETELSDSTLAAITPFIPPKWKILSTPVKKVVFENNFLVSRQHQALIRWGIEQGKIRQVSWDLVKNALLPTDVVVDTLVLDMRCVEDIGNMLTKVQNSSHRKVHCKYLWCMFPNPFCDTVLPLQDFLECLRFIDFQLISFQFVHHCVTVENEMFNSQQQLIPHICNSLTEGKLRNVHMNSMSDHTCAHEYTMINTARSLIVAERLESLEMFVADVEQDEIEMFVRSAAQSSYLRNFVFGTKNCCVDRPNHPFVVNLAALCDDGQKSWEWVELVDVNVETSEVDSKCFLIRHLELANCSVSTNGSSLIHHCNVKSLNCSASLLAYTSSHWPYQTSLTELNITVDIGVMYRGLSPLAEKLQNLQVLALTMKSLDYFHLSLPIEQWLWNALSLLRLKGFEIWRFSKNANLAKDLVEGIVQCLEGRPSGAVARKENSHAERIQLEYLMLSDTEADSGQHAATCLQRLKTCLQMKYLRRLDMVFSTEDKDPEHFEFRSIFLATKVFPREEGFSVEHDLWGSKVDDSIYSKGKHRMSLSQKDRISVTFSQRPCRTESNSKNCCSQSK